MSTSNEVMERLPERERIGCQRIRQSGFTLIEISIVLVIISLIVGTIIGAKDLIESAESRRIMTQIDEYRSAVITFHTKYSGMPGDLLNRRAVQFGFTASINGFRNGNGRIDSGANYVPDQCGESNLFWNDLSVSGIIKGSYTGTDGNYGGQTCGASDITTVVPRLATNPTDFLVVYSDATDNSSYFLIYGGATSVAGYGWYAENSSPSYTSQNLKALTAATAFRIDSKIDDGLPFSGQVTARSTANNWQSIPLDTAAAPASGVCVSNVAINPYNVKSSTDRSCVLMFPMSP